jgi:hypothetical protein
MPHPEAQIAHSVFGHLLHPHFGGIRRTYLGVSHICFCISRTHVVLAVHFRIHCIVLVTPCLALVALGLWHLSLALVAHPVWCSSHPSLVFVACICHIEHLLHPCPHSSIALPHAQHLLHYGFRLRYQKAFR